MGYKCKKEAAAYAKQYYIDNKEDALKKNAQYYKDNKEAISSRSKQYREENKEAIAANNKSYHLKTSYGLTEADYQSILEAQDGCCPICLKHHTEFTKRLAVDHIHDRDASGVDYNKGVPASVRGLLCTDCNTSIGKLGDSLDNFLRLIAYKMGSDLCPFTLTKRETDESD